MKFTRDKLLIYSLSLIFVVFGLLKMFNISPVKEIVQQTLFIFDYQIAFLLLGIMEVAIGMGLLFQKARKLAALCIILHLSGIILISILTPSLTFSSDTILTFYGEFVLKNLVLIAVAWKIFKL